MSNRTWIPAVLVPFALVAGCASVSGVDDDARYAALPTGVTLLDSEREECDGIVQVAERTSLGRARGNDLVIRPGQNATFEIDPRDDDVRWSCIGESRTDERDEIDCPDATSHVRITREAEGDNFVIECYGERNVR